MNTETNATKTISPAEVEQHIRRAHKMRAEAFGSFFNDLLTAWRGDKHGVSTGAATA